MPKFALCLLLMPAETILLKLNASHFPTLNHENANKNKMKKILIAVSNENKADFKEDLRVYSQEPIDWMYKW